MRPLLFTESEKREGEPVISLVCGVPALSIGLGAIVLLLSYWAGRPIGATGFYRVEQVRLEETSRMGQLVVTSVERVLPSMLLLGMVAVGMCCGGIGIHLSRRRSLHRRVATSAAGVIACAIAFFLVWMMYACAGFMESF
jgi:hypothetical protein